LVIFSNAIALATTPSESPAKAGAQFLQFLKRIGIITPVPQKEKGEISRGGRPPREILLF
jgi:hypothetical protein